MFTKLLKHEFKSQAGLFSVLSGAALAAGLIGGLMMTIFSNSVSEMMSSKGNEILGSAGMVFSMLFMMMMVLAIVAYSFAVALLLYYRFYKRHYSDEGYLTFTLPATSHQILLSSITNIVIWSFIANLVAIISAAFILIPLFNMVQKFTGESLWAMYDPLWTQINGWHIFLYIIMAIGSYAGGLILPLLSITLGAVVVKKYKLLAGFGIYYGITTVLSVITGVFTFTSTIGEFAILDVTGTYTGLLAQLGPSVLYLGIGIGGYFLMHYLVDEKLNLP